MINPVKAAGSRCKPLRYIEAFVTTAVLSLYAAQVQAIELIIGKETLSPGVVFIFEGAIKDAIEPPSQHLALDQTDVHIEALVNWGAQGSIPESAPAGGFVPYLRINAVVTSQVTGKSVHATLVPHVNLVDNFHYARNIALPSAITDKYEVVFYVHPPDEFGLSFHKDWIKAHGKVLIEPATFRYRNVNFNEIARATRP